MLTVSQALAQNNTYRYQKYQSTLSSFSALPIKKSQEEVSKEKNKKIKNKYAYNDALRCTDEAF